MSNTRSLATYPHPFSKAYWKDAASELKSTKMLVIIAMLTALRIALKPLAIPLGPQLSIQTAMLATALGAMLYGPVAAIPAAIISDTIGFMIYPTGDYFLPFVLTEIASTMLYALFLYRAKPTALRVMLARFAICFFVNVILQQVIFAWQYVYMGQPEKVQSTILGAFTTIRIFKNLCMFPIEAVVLTLFLKLVTPVAARAKLISEGGEGLTFKPKQIVALVCLMAIGIGSAFGYLGYHYTQKSRSADYTTEERVAIQKEMAQFVLDNTDDWDDETVFCVVDSAFRPLFGAETDYTLAVYILDEEAFAKGQAENKNYTEDTLWAYSKSSPGKDKYKSLIKVASITLTRNEQTGEVTNLNIKPVQ